MVNYHITVILFFTDCSSEEQKWAQFIVPCVRSDSIIKPINVLHELVLLLDEFQTEYCKYKSIEELKDKTDLSKRMRDYCCNYDVKFFSESYGYDANNSTSYEINSIFGYLEGSCKSIKYNIIWTNDLGQSLLVAIGNTTVSDMAKDIIARKKEEE